MQPEEVEAWLAFERDELQLTWDLWSEPEANG
jgi:hypothetical protein